MLVSKAALFHIIIGCSPPSLSLSLARYHQAAAGDSSRQLVTARISAVWPLSGGLSQGRKTASRTEAVHNKEAGIVQLCHRNPIYV